MYVTMINHSSAKCYQKRKGKRKTNKLAKGIKIFLNMENSSSLTIKKLFRKSKEGLHNNFQMYLRDWLMIYFTLISSSKRRLFYSKSKYENFPF